MMAANPVYLALAKQRSADSGGYDADAQAYFTAVETAGGTFGAGEKDWINNRVLNLKGIAAGDITAGQTFDIWDGIESFTLFKSGQNVGSGTAIKQVVGPDGTLDIGGTGGQWDTKGISTQNFAKATDCGVAGSGVQIGYGNSTGGLLYLKLEFDSGWSNFNDIMIYDTNSLKWRIEGGNEFRWDNAQVKTVLPNTVFHGIYRVFDTFGQTGFGQRGEAALHDGASWAYTSDFASAGNFNVTGAQGGYRSGYWLQVCLIVSSSTEFTRAEVEKLKPIFDAAN